MLSLLSIFDEWAAVMGVGIWLIAALCIVGAAIAIGAVVLGVFRAIIFWNYWIARAPAACGVTGEQAALGALQQMGVTDVTVKKEGFFRALFFNNHYNPSKKTIFLRRTTFYGKSVTAVALSVEKAALVMQERQNSGKFRARWRLQKLALFGPIFFIPFVLAGIILDFVMSLNGGSFTGTATLIATVLGLVFVTVSMVLAGLTVSVEKQGTQDALALLTASNLLLPDELSKAESALKAYILAYITDYIIAILKFIQVILKILWQIFKSVFRSDKK